jgi:hypothetical protein
MAKRLSDDNPCKGCGARRKARCICEPKYVKRQVLSVADLEARARKKSETAEHCAKNRECMLLNGHSRPDCFTYADDAELARFRATETPATCGHEAYVKCLLPEGHEGPHQGNARFGAGWARK